MTDEDFEFLGKFEKHFDSMREASWCPTIMMSDARILLDIYKRNSISTKNINLSCGKCVGSMIRSLDNIYTREKELREKMEEMEENQKS